MHVFVVPDLDGPLTGGTLFNGMLIGALRALNVDCAVCSAECGRGHLSRAAAGDVVWVDSLFLDLVPKLAGAPRRRAQLGLLLHYLPSLVARGGSIRVWDLTTVESSALWAADVVMVPSHYMRQMVRSLVRPPPPIVVLEPGRSVLGLAPKTSAPLRAVMVANLLPGKGVLPFLKALAKYTCPGDGYTLDIVGSCALDVDYARACRQVAESEPLQGHVRILGARTPDATAAHMASSNLFLSSSTMESYGMALAEARGLALPILAVRGGNVEMLVERRAGGQLVPDAPTLAGAFVALCRERAELDQRLRAARANALSPRPWSRVAAEYLERVGQLEKARPTGRPARSEHVGPT